MKKVLYILLLVIEAFIGVRLLIAAGNTMGWIPSVIAVAVCAALLVWQVKQLKNTEDAKRRRKIKGRIIWIMLVPTLPMVVYILSVIIALVGSI